MYSNGEINLVRVLALADPNGYLGSDPFGKVVYDKRRKYFLENAFCFF